MNDAELTYFYENAPLHVAIAFTMWVVSRKPEGDSVRSCVAFYKWLQRNGKELCKPPDEWTLELRRLTGME